MTFFESWDSGEYDTWARRKLRAIYPGEQVSRPVRETTLSAAPVAHRIASCRRRAVTDCCSRLSAPVTSVAAPAASTMHPGIDGPGKRQESFVHSCPHCGATAPFVSVRKAAITHPLVCATCSGNSWFREPFGLGMPALSGVFATNYFASLHLPRSQMWLAYLATTVLMLCAYFLLIWRFGELRAIAGAAPAKPNRSGG